MELIMKDVRIAFPDVFLAKQFQGAGDLHYSATFLVSPTSPTHTLLQNTINSVAEERWKEKAKAVLKTIEGNNQKCCYYPGDLKEYDGFAGMYALSAKRSEKSGHPKVVDQKRHDLSREDGKPYGGCYVNAKVDIWAQDNEYGKGIRATLIAVQFLRDGDAFSATGPATAEGFEDEKDESEGLI